MVTVHVRAWVKHRECANWHAAVGPNTKRKSIALLVLMALVAVLFRSAAASAPVKVRWGSTSSRSSLPSAHDTSSPLLLAVLALACVFGAGGGRLGSRRARVCVCDEGAARWHG